MITIMTYLTVVLTMGREGTRATHKVLQGKQSIIDRRSKKPSWWINPSLCAICIYVKFHCFISTYKRPSSMQYDLRGWRRHTSSRRVLRVTSSGRIVWSNINHHPKCLL
jgi:hypothetical protein